MSTISGIPKRLTRNPTRAILIRVLAALVLGFVFIGGRFGPRIASNDRVFCSPNGRYVAKSSEYHDSNYHGWAFQTVNRFDDQKHVDVGCAMWYDVIGLCGDTFVTDDGELLIALDSYSDTAFFPGIRFFDRSGFNSILYRDICDEPRWLYPFEPRPANGQTEAFVPTNRWVSAASFDGRLLHVETTGSHSVDIDVNTRIVVRQRFNYATVVRWIVYALISLPPAFVFFRDLTALFARLFQRIWERYFPANPNRCRTCGYLLFGLTQARCPECGTHFGADAIREVSK